MKFCVKAITLMRDSLLLLACHCLMENMTLGRLLEMVQICEHVIENGVKD